MPSGNIGYVGEDCDLIGAGCEIGCKEIFEEIKECKRFD
jgi:hypothetical protein